MERIDDLEKLKEIVLKLEKAAAEGEPNLFWYLWLLGQNCSPKTESRRNFNTRIWCFVLVLWLQTSG
jgi:hypothetical protein